MTHTFILACIMTISLLPTPAESGNKSLANSGKTDVMKGKTKTDRTIAIDTIVDASPDEVFELWTTSEGIKKYFAPDGNIDLKEGGEYTIIFDPKKDPEGSFTGTKGCKILSFHKGKDLSFEWNIAVPFIAPELKSKEFSTWVELQFETVANQMNKTMVSFRHFGFKHGKGWDEVYVWFRDTAWKQVLADLAKYCKERKPKIWTDSIK